MTIRSRKALPLLMLCVAVVFLFLAIPEVRGEVAVDTDALPQVEARMPTSFFDLIRKGRWLMAPIIACSIIGLAFVIERGVGLRRNVVMPGAFFETAADLVRSDDALAAEALCREQDTPLAKLLRAILLCEGGGRMDMEAALENEGGRVIWQMRRNGKVLGVIAGVSPLLGLLGTVWGMIRAFETYALAQGAPRPEVLAVGIYEALITTAAGLTVAIPCLLFHHYFRGRADSMVREMEDLGLEFINIVQKKDAPVSAATTTPRVAGERSAP